MSPDTPTSDRPFVGRDTASPLGLVRRIVTRPLTTVAFWSAVILPLLTVAYLATGVEFSSITDVFTLASLFMMNVAALVVGHGHKRT